MQISQEEVVKAIWDGKVLSGEGGVISYEEIPTEERYSGMTDEVIAAKPSVTLESATLRAALVTAAEKTGADRRGLRLRGVHLVGQVDIQGLDLPFGLGFWGCWFDRDIWADRLAVDELVLEGCRVTGWVGSGVHIRGRLDVYQSAPLHQIFLSESEVGRLRIRPDLHAEAPTHCQLRLYGTTVHQFGVELSSPAGVGECLPLGDVDGLTIETLNMNRQDEGVGAADVLVALLSRHPEQGDKDALHAATWHEFADALERSGDVRGADDLRVEFRRRRARRLSWPRRLWNRVIDMTTRFGYSNHRAAVLVVLLFLLVWLLAWWQPVSGADTYWSGIYALELVVPAVNLGQISAHGLGDTFWFASVLAGLRVVSWAVVALFLSGVAGLLDKPSRSRR